MAAAIDTLGSGGRTGPRIDATLLIVNIVATATVYATASGGLPIDLATVLNQGAPFDNPYIDPYDVITAMVIGTSTSGYLVCDFAFTPANATYTTAGWPFNTPAATASTVRPPQILATAPASVRLRAIGASNSNHAPFGEVADGAVTESFTLMLVIAKSGSNS